MEVTNAKILSSYENVQKLAYSEKASETTEKNSQTSIAKTVEGNRQEESRTKEQEERLIKLIEDSNGKVQDEQNEFQFSVHEQTKQILIKVIDKETKEVIKEFPPEKILDMIAKMCEVAGIFVDEKR